MTLKKIYLLFLAVGFLTACGNEEGTANSSLEREKLELEKKKLELEEAKFKAEQEKEKNSTLQNANKKNKITDLNKNDYDYLIGIWTGIMNKKKLTVAIENINGNIIKGYNILGSNKRPLTGRIYPDKSNGIFSEQLNYDKIYKLVLIEPGDDKWDGIFNIHFMTGIGKNDRRFYFGEGNWRSNNGKLEHQFTIRK